jgi:hypothetical protein
MKRTLIVLIYSSITAGFLGILNAASAQAPTHFGYGCGTGCSAQSWLISPINKDVTRSMRYATF